MLRPLLATLWIEQGRGAVPMCFETLVDALIEDLRARGLAVERLCLEADMAQGDPCTDVEPDPLSATDP